jgi:hypothetical protein
VLALLLPQLTQAHRRPQLEVLRAAGDGPRQGPCGSHAQLRLYQQGTVARVIPPSACTLPLRNSAPPFAR